MAYGEWGLWTNRTAVQFFVSPIFNAKNDS